MGPGFGTTFGLGCAPEPPGEDHSERPTIRSGQFIRRILTLVGTAQERQSVSAFVFTRSAPLLVCGTLGNRLGRKDFPSSHLEPRGFIFPEEGINKCEMGLASMGYPWPRGRTEEKQNP